VVDGDERGRDRLAYLRQLAQGEVALVELPVADDGVEDFVDDGLMFSGSGRASERAAASHESASIMMAASLN
jgi:phage gp36-like protein